MLVPPLPVKSHTESLPNTAGIPEEVVECTADTAPPVGRTGVVEVGVVSATHCAPAVGAATVVVVVAGEVGVGAAMFAVHPVVASKLRVFLRQNVLSPYSASLSIPALLQIHLARSCAGPSCRHRGTSGRHPF